MRLQLLPEKLSVFQLESLDKLNLSASPLFLGITEEEISVVAPTEKVPENTINREDGWRAFRIAGVLNFSLVGILANIATLLADQGISIFAVSTYNTDYILLKEDKLEQAKAVLSTNGYLIEAF